MPEKTISEISKSLFGFWVYIMTDCVLFASLFATFVILRNNIAGGPAGYDFFSLPFILAETLILLTSSFTCGLGLIAAQQKKRQLVYLWFGLTFVLGLTFISLEITEFRHLYLEGHGWQQSAFLSSFFTLVGTHGLHVTVGLIWMAALISRIYQQGFTLANQRRLTMLALFWHFLDIIWIFIFTIVYMIGEL